MSGLENGLLDERLVGQLKITVVRVHDLKDVAAFGDMHPQVAISVNAFRQYTSTKEDGGCACDFNEVLNFNVDCQPEDLVHIKVKHDSKIKDTTIGVFSVAMGQFIKAQKKVLKVQLVDEDSYSESRGIVELIPEYTGTHQPPVMKSPEPANRGL